LRRNSRLLQLQDSTTPPSWLGRPNEVTFFGDKDLAPSDIATVPFRPMRIKMTHSDELGAMFVDNRAPRRLG